MKNSLIFSFTIAVLLACNHRNENLGCAVIDPNPICGNVDELKVPEPNVFKAKCASCHSLIKNATGPKLRNVLARVPSEEWFDAYVRNEDSLLLINDSYAVEIQKWSVTRGIHNHKDMTDAELDEIKAYLSQ